MSTYIAVIRSLFARLSSVDSPLRDAQVIGFIHYPVSDKGGRLYVSLSIYQATVVSSLAICRQNIFPFAELQIMNKK